MWKSIDLFYRTRILHTRIFVSMPEGDDASYKELFEILLSCVDKIDVSEWFTLNSQVFYDELRKLDADL